ncbi:hypothetical protein BAUCODRAFT_437285 [Baudoinia panamericana UAMH 10762]|uniref:Uncharacterized protein n=1 Tax=Baudoinia panamericana (strain UAMH 10762) TaxID=717646 RepID=M2MZM7_BAUPA|nr:uncharacterized protein BAUCODRAFT_437285 [Baudoinia panamericana UAMH 10762]EMC97073.1 hypothetical protein BAUCODRAFT_437285 [Baudoinia panamericana UAMH 10762]
MMCTRGLYTYLGKVRPMPRIRRRSGADFSSKLIERDTSCLARQLKHSHLEDYDCGIHTSYPLTAGRHRSSFMETFKGHHI